MLAAVQYVVGACSPQPAQAKPSGQRTSSNAALHRGSAPYRQMNSGIHIPGGNWLRLCAMAPAGARHVVSAYAPWRLSIAPG